MSNLILDHIFCFCERPAADEVEIAIRNGFTVTPEKQHQDQGTANRCILFHENYLEFIFINSESEACASPLHLERRAKWKDTDASPFGIGLRGQLDKNDREQFWEHKPTYLPNGNILIHKSNEEHPELPLIFVLTPSVKPAERNIDDSLLTHRSSSKAIKRVAVNGPLAAWPSISPVAGVNFSKGTFPSMTVFVDGDIRKPLTFNKLLSIKPMLLPYPSA